MINDIVRQGLEWDGTYDGSYEAVVSMIDNEGLDYWLIDFSDDLDLIKDDGVRAAAKEAARALTHFEELLDKWGGWQ